MGNLLFPFFNSGSEPLLLSCKVVNAECLFSFEDRPSDSCRVLDYYSVDDLGFQDLDSGEWTLLQTGKVGIAGLLCTLGKQTF